MEDTERYQRGMARRRKVLGDAWVDRADARKTACSRRSIAACRPATTRSNWRRKIPAETKG
jgi:hypothetical protein